MPPTQPDEPLRPIPFDAAPPQAPASAAATPGQRAARWVIPALLGLSLLTALVLFWLPDRVAPPDVAQAPAASTAPTAPPPGAAARAPATPDAAPWSEALQARLRREAQDVLEQLLEVQFALEEAGVAQWAPQRHAQAIATATAGDELYQSRDYEAATAQYRAALEQLRQLEEAMPEELASRLQAAREAIGAGDQAAALEALDVAALIEPGHPALPGLRQRAERLPELLALLESAAELRAAGDLAGAEQQLRLATALDPEHQAAGAELVQVAKALREQNFNAAMSEGYAALDAGRFDRARQAFERARTLQGDGSGEADNALAEVETAQTAASLATLRRQGRQFEDRERWREAVEVYRKALQTDANLLFATEGLARASRRAQLDAGLRAVMERPQRLGDTAVAQTAEELLRQARAIPEPGPVLREQADRVAELLDWANTPVAVTLRSDEATEVTVYKVAHLGRIREHTLKLRPGTYTAVGRREGYRDVRVQFSVGEDGNSGPVTVICTEPV